MFIQNKLFIIALFTGMSLSMYASDEPVKVDLNHNGRQDSEVNESGYTSWRIVNGKTDQLVVNDVTFTLTSTGDGILKTNWYAAGIQTGGSQLVNDGVFVSDIPAGSETACIELKIKGLEPGRHTILTYHNQVDNPANNTFPDMEIYYNGTLMEVLTPTVRVSANALAAKFYTEFTIENDEEAIFEFKIVKGTSASSKMPVLNGFEIGTSNADKQAILPVPADKDEHIDADNDAFNLQWTAADNTVSHDVYFGTNLQNVQDADKSSPEYKGNQTATNYTVSGLYSMDTYYWRIDETDNEGTVTKGNVWYFRPRQLAFYGAEGYGRFARGGRGGIVVKVTNLNDSGPGSLRDAVENPVYEEIPRTIIFDVSGIITIDSRLSVNKPYITIAGQTAPGKGICVRGYAFGIGGVNDVVFRHLRLRVGTDDTTDGMGMSGADHCIIDHASISWSKDEATSSRNAKNITFQRCLISEPLNRAGHKNYPPGTAHGYAGSIGGDISSYHHNLLVHSEGRNWSLAGGLDRNGFYQGKLDIFNNVVYNWGGRTTDGGANQVNFVNNYYKPGVESNQFYALNAQWDGFPGTQKYYCSGNIVEGKYENLSDPKNGCRADSNHPDPWASPYEPFFPSYATIHTAKEAYKQVLSDVGATLPAFDDHDQRVVRETLEGSWTFRGSYNAPNGTRGIIDNQEDVGGWEDYGNEVRPANYDSDNDGLPDWWEKEVSKTNPNSPAGDFSDTNADPDRDGFTYLDDFLDWMANPNYTVESGNEQIDLKKFAAGFTKSPVFSIEETANCMVTLENDSVAVASYSQGTSKLASFTFKCVDSEGTVLTRKVNLYFPNATSNAINQPDAKKFEIKYRYSGKNVLYLSVHSGGLEEAAVSCFDVSGRKIFQNRISISSAFETQVDMSSATTGVYFIQVITGKGERTFKIVKTN